MRLKLAFGFVLVAGLGLIPGGLGAQTVRELPSFAVIQKLVEQHFAEQSHLRSGDIICQSDVRSLFSTLESAGWIVGDRNEILNKMLPANDPLIGILRSPHGAKFMSQVANDNLIYDRLDRVVREPGGQRLLADLIKLPNAASYAKQKTPPGIPDLIDFLPKDRSGKTRRVKDYDKATQKIYTSTDFKRALQKSYETAGRDVGN